MPAAEIIAIGTEILLGEIQDTNTRYLARNLRDAGVDLFRTMVVGDNAARIAGVIKEAMSRAQIVITTGGLGPTVDDPTRLAVAMTMGVDTVFLPELWGQIEERFRRYGRQATENNRRQAYVPAGAIPVENPVGTAPAFIVETPEHAIIALPGVPREMEYLYEHAVLPYLRRRFNLSGVIKARVLHTSGAGESQIDALIGDLEELSNPTVGLLAHAGQVDVRITAKAESERQADAMIETISEQVHARIGEWIYGQDADTLESVVHQQLQSRALRLAVLECGLNGELARRLLASGIASEADCPSELTDGTAPLNGQLEALRSRTGAQVALGARLYPGAEKQVLQLWLLTPTNLLDHTRTYGGPPPLTPTWATNTALDFLHRALKNGAISG